MEKLEYDITIKADRRKVWDTMIDLESYKEWTGVSWPASTYEGVWKEGESLRFAAPGEEGLLAKLVEVRQYEVSRAVYIAVLRKDGSEDRESEIARSLIGMIETYLFSEKNGETTLHVAFETNPEWKKMLDDGWPPALRKLKEICER